MDVNHTPLDGVTDEALVISYGGMVRRMAHQLVAKLPANVEVDDLVQEGLIALLGAYRRFDPVVGVQFETFASQSIRGAMLDLLRREDSLSRHDRRLVAALNKAINGFEHVNRGELANTLGITLPELEELLILRGYQSTSIDWPLSLEDEEGDTLVDSIPSSEGDPVAILELRELLERFEAALKQSSTPRWDVEKRRQILYLHLDGMMMRQIAELFGVTESRICKLIQEMWEAVRGKSPPSSFGALE